MAATKRVLIILMSLLVLIALSSLAEAKNRLQRSECKPRCDFRCSATSHKKPCKFYCNKCCKTCLCVPDGVYGNKQTCPCYNSWKTKEGKPKCP